MSSTNPLIPPAQDKDADKAFVLQGSQDSGSTGQTWQGDDRDAAANLIRQKVADAYGQEPAAKEELKSVAHLDSKPSKHQAALLKIQSESTSVADIQTKWHEYYASLPEHEKHEVWQEFYQDHAKQSRYAQFAQRQSGPVEQKPAQPKPVAAAPKATASGAIVSSHAPAAEPRQRLRDARSAREIKEGIRRKVTADGKLQKKHHLQSLFFGLGMGVLSLVIVLFGLFNEMIIAPFIQPSRNVSATPIIASNASLAADGQPKVIIPKINVEIPVDYNVASMQEQVIQKALDHGTVHYPATVKPGEQGNTAIFGHSSNNIFNPGKYKFAFVLLNRLEDGDTFYLTYNNQLYAYRVFKKQVVAPNETWVLNPVEGKTATAALITCDPPGTTINRLVVWGEQISPDPATATASETPQQIQSTAPNNSDDSSLVGAPQSMWSRVTSFLNPFD